MNQALSMAGENLTYDQMNELASSVPPGAQGVVILPFGNGSERMLNNRNLGSQFHGINFNLHHKGHLFRAAQEGIVFSFKYGMDMMQ